MPWSIPAPLACPTSHGSLFFFFFQDMGRGGVRQQAARRIACPPLVFVPPMSQALAPTRGAEERQMFTDRLEEGVRRPEDANPIRIKCLSFRASETQRLRETGVTEIFWEPSTSGAHLSEWACPEGRVAAGDVTRGPLFHWPISSFTQGRADYLPHKLATNRDGRIRRKEPLQGVSGGGASLQPKSWQPAGWPSTQSIIQNC